MSKQVTCGRSGGSVRSVRIEGRLRGWCRGANGVRQSTASIVAASSSAGSSKKAAVVDDAVPGADKPARAAARRHPVQCGLQHLVVRGVLRPVPVGENGAGPIVRHEAWYVADALQKALARSAGAPLDATA